VGVDSYEDASSDNEHDALRRRHAGEMGRGKSVESACDGGVERPAIALVGVRR